MLFPCNSPMEYVFPASFLVPVASVKGQVKSFECLFLVVVEVFKCSASNRGGVLSCGHFSALPLSRWRSGGKSPFRTCHLSDSRYVAGARGWGGHAVLWRPAPRLLPAGGHRVHCSSDFSTSRHLALHLHACGSSLSTAPHCWSCLCGPSYLSGARHRGAEGEPQTEKERTLAAADMINMNCAVAAHLMNALSFTILVEKINFQLDWDLYNLIGASYIYCPLGILKTRRGKLWAQGTNVSQGHLINCQLLLCQYSDSTI